MRRTLSFPAFAAVIALAVPAAARGDAGGDFLKLGDFDAADKAYSAALAANPKDTAAMLGLARIRLYEDRRSDALRLAEGIPSNDPGVGRSVGISGEVNRREADLDPSDVAVPPGGAHVPFVATDPLPILEVRVNGKSDAYFFIDTGASEAILDTEYARELGLTSAAAGNGTFAGGKTAEVRNARIDSLALGTARVRNLSVGLLPTRGIKLDETHRIDGIIGTGVLYRFLATIDYPRGELILRPRADSAEFEKAAAEHKDVVVPMWLFGDHFILARAKMNDGPERLFNIDTGGAGVGVMPSPASMADSKVKLDTAHSGEGQGGGGSVKVIPFTATVQLASIKRDDVPGLYTPDGNQYGLFPFDIGGSLSHQFFRPYALTFDFVAMKLVVATK